MQMWCKYEMTEDVMVVCRRSVLLLSHREEQDVRADHLRCEGICRHVKVTLQVCTVQCMSVSLCSYCTRLKVDINKLCCSFIKFGRRLFNKV